jgi:hypothetical protein
LREFFELPGTSPRIALREKVDPQTQAAIVSGSCVRGVTEAGFAARQYTRASYTRAFSGESLPRTRSGVGPVRVKKTRQIKNLEPRFDSIETEKALGVQGNSAATMWAIGVQVSVFEDDHGSGRAAF